MLIEIHMLKNYPASNLNRDDMGSPKTCFFGGVQRGRISSQCLKHSWRSDEVFKEAIGDKNLGIRTRFLPELVADKLKEANIDENYVNQIKNVLAQIAQNDSKKEETVDKENKYVLTPQVIFYTPEDIQAVTDGVIDELKKCNSLKDVKSINAKTLQDILKKGNKRAVTVDMALFGRMVTSNAFADVEASMQVAHAFSTNRIIMESDFFTAVDDIIQAREEETGSGMMGDVDFDSACYYIYASIDTDKFLSNLQPAPEAEQIAKVAIPALIKTMAFANPPGKQNSCAAHTMPSAILLECK